MYFRDKGKPSIRNDSQAWGLGMRAEERMGLVYQKYPRL